MKNRNYKKKLLLGVSLLGVFMGASSHVNAATVCTTTDVTITIQRDYTPFCVDHAGRKMSELINPVTNQPFGNEACEIWASRSDLPMPGPIPAHPDPIDSKPCTYQNETCVVTGDGGDGWGGGGGDSGDGGCSNCADTDGDGRGDMTEQEARAGGYSYNSVDNMNDTDRGAAGGGGGSLFGGGGDGDGCFVAGSMVLMEDHTEVAIEDIKLGDLVAKGGRVYAVGSFLVTDIYDYKGVKVSGSHAVNEDGYWMRVRDSSLAKLVSTEETPVHVHANEGNRIVIDGIEFADYAEIGREETNLYDRLNDEAIRLLNQKERKKRMKEIDLSLVS